MLVTLHTGVSALLGGIPMIRLLTFGTLRLFKDGQEVTLPVQRRARTALLVYLAVNRELTRAQAMTVFWPDSDEHKTRHALS